MPTLTKPVSPTLAPASGADDNTVELFEIDNFELDIRIIVPQKFRPIATNKYTSYTCYPSCDNRNTICGCDGH